MIENMIQSEREEEGFYTHYFKLWYFRDAKEWVWVLEKVQKTIEREKKQNKWGTERGRGKRENKQCKEVEEGRYKSGKRAGAKAKVKMMLGRNGSEVKKQVWKEKGS